jgi:2-phospho-L-lactate guanylyltransferase
MSTQRAWALVPVKPFTAAKSRLAAALTDATRARLAQELLGHTLRVLAGVPRLSGVAVVSRDPAVDAVARSHGALVLPEVMGDLNEIVDNGLDALQAAGALTAVVVLSDLPELSAEDIEGLLELGEQYPLVIAPDTQDEGTNALLVTPPDRFRTCFGRRGSFWAHLGRADALHIKAAVLRRPALAFDLDTPNDLRRLAAGPWRFAALAAAGRSPIEAP